MEQAKVVTRKDIWGRDEEIALIKDAFIMAGNGRNFSGEKDGPYDQPGRRYFTVRFTDPTVAQDLADHNYPVKFRQYEDGTSYGYLRVHVKPEINMPCIVTVVSDGVETTLNPEDYAVLDGIRRDSEFSDTVIESAKLTLRIWEYRPNEFSCQLEEGKFYLRPISAWQNDPFEENFGPGDAF